jgi:hypothetical protein
MAQDDEALRVQQESPDPEDGSYYVELPSEWSDEKRAQWLQGLADALAKCDQLEIAVVTTPGGALAAAPDPVTRDCISKVVVVVNGRPCGPRLLDPMTVARRTGYRHEGTWDPPSTS